MSFLGRMPSVKANGNSECDQPVGKSPNRTIGLRQQHLFTATPMGILISVRLREL